MSIKLPAHGWTPRDYQLDAYLYAMEHDTFRMVLAWARRHGKDETAMHITAVKSQQRVGVYYHCLPEYAQARKTLWDMVNPHTRRRRWQDAFPPEIIKHVDEQQMKLTFHNGSVWQLVGSDNVDSLVGGSVVGLVLSEAALAKPTTMAYFEPMLAENKGWSISVSSVRGKNHFYNEYLSAVNDENSYASHLSARDTNVFSGAALDDLRKKYIDRHGGALGEALFNQEFLSSWDSAVVGAVWGAELGELGEKRAFPIKHDPRYPVFTSWDIGSADGTVILFWQIIQRTPRLIDWEYIKDMGLAACADALRERPYRYTVHVGPHDVDSKTWELNGISRREEAKKYGIFFETVGRVSKKSDGLAATAQLIKMMEINVGETPVEDKTEDCQHILDTLKQYRYSYDTSKNIMSKVPVHDWTSHYADALQTFAIYLATKGTKHVEGRASLQGHISDDEYAEEMHYSNMRLSDILEMQRPRSTALRSAWG